MNTDYVLADSYELPSKGQIYKNKINPFVKIRSMTVAEEMKRLNKGEREYKTLADVIDDCVVEGKNMSSYDMCIGDFQYLMIKLRTQTYGPSYPVACTCPICLTTSTETINLNNLTPMEYTSELDKYFEVELPVSKRTVRLRL